MYAFPSQPNFLSKLERSRRLFGRKEKQEEEPAPPQSDEDKDDVLRFKEMLLRKEPAIPPPSLLLEDIGDRVPASRNSRPPPQNIPEIVFAAPPTENERG